MRTKTRGTLGCVGGHRAFVGWSLLQERGRSFQESLLCWVLSKHTDCLKAPISFCSPQPKRGRRLKCLLYYVYVPTIWYLMFVWPRSLSICPCIFSLRTIYTLFIILKSFHATKCPRGKTRPLQHPCFSHLFVTFCGMLVAFAFRRTRTRAIFATIPNTCMHIAEIQEERKRCDIVWPRFSFHTVTETPSHLMALV